jgi:DNA-binding XRE family transcriptional regulator
MAPADNSYHTRGRSFFGLNMSTKVKSQSPHHLPLTLGAAIRSRRKDLGLSQEGLAFRSGLHRTYVADLERGARNPSLMSIAKIAKALKMSLSDLFTNIQSEDKEARRAELV